MKRALITRHHESETMGKNFQAILERNGFELIPCNLFESAPAFDRFCAPLPGEVDLVMAFGGPMSVNDDLPALHREREFMSAAIAQGKPVFGVCLGAQMMATALGGKVEPSGGYQFGLRKIHITGAGHADSVFGRIDIPLVPTLHGECFSIPEGATTLAECDILLRDGRFRRINMAFRYGLSYAFQFEPQLTLNEFKVWNNVFFGDYSLMGDSFIAEEEAARNLREFSKFVPEHQRQMTDLLKAFLNNANLL